MVLRVRLTLACPTRILYVAAAAAHARFLKNNNKQESFMVILSLCSRTDLGKLKCQRSNNHWLDISFYVLQYEYHNLTNKAIYTTGLAAQLRQKLVSLFPVAEPGRNLMAKNHNFSL